MTEQQLKEILDKAENNIYRYSQPVGKEVTIELKGDDFVTQVAKKITYPPIHIPDGWYRLHHPKYLGVHFAHQVIDDQDLGFGRTVWDMMKAGYTYEPVILMTLKEFEEAIKKAKWEEIEF